MSYPSQCLLFSKQVVITVLLGFHMFPKQGPPNINNTVLHRRVLPIQESFTEITTNHALFLWHTPFPKDN